MRRSEIEVGKRYQARIPMRKGGFTTREVEVVRHVVDGLAAGFVSCIARHPQGHKSKLYLHPDAFID